MLELIVLVIVWLIRGGGGDDGGCGAWAVFERPSAGRSQ